MRAGEKDRVAEVRGHFERDTAEHGMAVEMNEGVHRSLSFRNPRSNAYAFRIVTWPGALAIHGDMGSYVFSRLRDMFEFFRGDQINPSYWAEKVEAADCGSGVMHYCADAARAELADLLSDWIRDESGEALTDAGVALRAGQWIGEHCLEFDRGLDVLVSDLYDAEPSPIYVSDLPSTFGKIYSFQYLWCCHAIVWAIARFDAHLAQQAPAEECAA